MKNIRGKEEGKKRMFYHLILFLLVFFLLLYIFGVEFKLICFCIYSFIYLLFHIG